MSAWRFPSSGTSASSTSARSFWSSSKRSASCRASLSTPTTPGAASRNGKRNGRRTSPAIAAWARCTAGAPWWSLRRRWSAAVPAAVQTSGTAGQSSMASWSSRLPMPSSTSGSLGSSARPNSSRSSSSTRCTHAIALGRCCSCTGRTARPARGQAPRASARPRVPPTTMTSATSCCARTIGMQARVSAPRWQARSIRTSAQAFTP
mmetsp:Transcript_100763/g.289537  ORF Transcript_100763/g.289537 Transcript_100763/m.289537 type:complete len:206 (+) Transcript_100763:75-692(+)